MNVATFVYSALALTFPWAVVVGILCARCISLESKLQAFKKKERV